MDWFYRTDEQIKTLTSERLQKYLSDYQHSVNGEDMTYLHFLDHLQKKTGYEIPLSTFRNYCHGIRLKIGFIMFMSTLLRIPIAELLGKDFAKADLANSLNQAGTVIYQYDSSEVGIVLPNAIATAQNIRKDSARSVNVTKENLMSGDLAPGCLAIIDTGINTPSLSGDYYITHKGQINNPKYFVKLMVPTDGDIKLQHSDGEIEELTKAQINDKLSILGKVISRLG